MKLRPHEVATSQSCSCTSCLNGTDSDRGSLKRVKAGSRIDKLYFGKYLPLREKKLLDKLVKTRAVYDDVRNQLLSESSNSIDNKANLKPRKRLPVLKTDKEHDYTEKSSDIFELVDLVDRGVLLGQKKISECCSCCSCGSKIHLQEHKSKGLRHRHAGGHVSSKSSAVSRQRMAHDIRMGKHVRYAKHIRSDPCTCTLQFSDLSKHNLKTTFKRMHQEQPQPVLEYLPFQESYPTSDTKNKRRTIKQSVLAEANKNSLVKCACKVKDTIESGAKKSFEQLITKTQKIKQMVEPSITKSVKRDIQKQEQLELSSLYIKQPALGEISRKALVKCACKVKDNMELGAMKSFEKIKDTKEKVIEKVEGSNRKSVQKDNEKQIPVFEPDNAIKVRKDSLTVYKKQLERKRQLKDWECDFECFPEECMPEECYRIKQRRKPTSQAKGHILETERKIKEGEISSASDANVQAYNVKKTQTKSKKSGTREKGYNLGEKTHISFELGTKKNLKAKVSKPGKIKKSKQIICTCEEVTSKKPSIAAHKTKSIKSMTSLHSTTFPLAKSLTTNKQKASRSLIKADRIAKASTSTTGTTKLPNASRNPNRIIGHLRESNSESDLIQNSRQAVRIGSSFSFNIEFHKDKSTSKPPIETHKIPSHGKIKTYHHRHRGSGTSQRQTIKNTHAGEYALKRCFCTLKLKAKGTKSKINKSFAKEKKDKAKSVKGSTQTTQESSASKEITVLSPMPDLRSYECEPMMCIPGSCNPKDCEKLIKKRVVKHNTIQTNTNHKNKSSSSATSKSIADLNYNKLQVAENKKINSPSVIPLNENGLPQTQVVRVGSSFSFNIEFSREKPTKNQIKIENETVKPKRNKSEKEKKENIFKKRPSIQQNFSPASSSSTKSRYSSAKHKLRRCFCTLGLSKPRNKKEKAKTFTRGTLTDSQSIKQIRPVNPSAMTKAMDVRKKLRKRFKLNLLSYECEPGACVPGECNPYECKEIITKRQIKLLKDHTKQSNTEYPKTKSAYSFTTKAVKTQAQKLQSTTPMTISKVNKKLKVANGRAITNTPNRQAVRIGSNFSFNVEFYKDVSSNNNNPIKDELEFSKFISTSVKNAKYNSTQVQKKRRSVLIGPALKRCFCTLKLQKPGKNKMKSTYISTGTETARLKEDMYPKSIKATKSTKTKKNYSNVKMLEPFECEPFICIPGKCNPYQCLEVIKRRDIIRQSQELGVSTDHVMKKSTASITHKAKRKVKDVQSYTEHKNSRTKKRRQVKYFLPNNNSENPLRQAVIISSNFSFNVEFFKNRISGDVVSKEILKTKPKIVKTKEALKNSVSQHKSQLVEIKKKHKASGVEHVLKRCFCTLKLQNKVKQQDKENKTFIRPFETTAMPIQVYMNRTNVIDNTNLTYLSVPLKETNVSNENNMIYYNRGDTNMQCNKENALIMNTNQYTKNRSVKYTESLFAKINDNQYQHMGLNPFLRSCFCTMNIQVEKSVKRSHKLKPYECEPGVCVPGECDPYVCQKIIMKRLMNRVSTMTGTKIKSISSGTTPLSPESKAKKNQYATTKPKDENELRSTVKYEPSLPQRQAVRVGSNFNFNIELYKDRSPSANTSESHNKPPRVTESTKSVKQMDKKLKSKGTKDYERNPYDKSSQSEVKMQSRSASVTPILKKCFCTLKLQKKGTQNNAINLNALKHKTKPPNKNNQLLKVKTAETGQNTNSEKPTRLFDLSPYECEPLVCVPGECDPYKCLELIHMRNRKRRTRDHGTVSIIQKKRSTSSITTQRSRKRKPKQIQARNIDTKPGYSTKPVDEFVKKPARQAVRIGSSCSFNIEFYKDRSPSGDRFDGPNLPQHYIKNERKITKDSQKHPPKELKKFAEHSSQDSSSVQHRDTQAKSPAKRVKSTKTVSFMKRCFCTAKLHVADEKLKADSKVKHNQKDSPSFLRKCLCKLKSITAVKEKPRKTANTGTEALVPTEKFIKQNTLNVAHEPQILEPYECEPGVCVPGECDPFVCEKIIQKRKAKLHTKMSTTDTPKRKSMSTSHKYSKASKGILTHAIEKRVPKEVDISLKEPRKPLRSSPQRNVVRIGSNFSFDIEFYKNRSPHFNQVQKVAAALKELPKEGKSPKIKPSPKTENKALTSNNMSLRNQKSQVTAVKKENKASGIGPILKRCFCTLKLHNQSNVVTDGPKKERKIKDNAKTSSYSTKGTETSNIKESPNVFNQQAMTYKLEPYECEPNICIPGECNPYECEKLIRKRLRESSTSTRKRKMKSTKSMISNASKSKDRTQQLNVKYKNRNHERVISLSQKPKKLKNVIRPSRQAVRIGSSFSFDIEFYKNKGLGDSPKNKAPMPQKEVIKYHYKRQLSTNARNRKSQHSKSVRDMDSQVLHKQVRSKMSQVAPFLKRCFCNLKLHKPDINPMARQNVATVTNKKLSKLSKVDDIGHKSREKNQTHIPRKKIDPYECEPGVCVPGQCDPYTCDELIKKRNKEMHSKLSGTVGSKDQSTISRGPASKSFKHKTSQRNPHVRKIGNNKTGDFDVATDKQELKPSKDSNRQAVRVGSSFSFDIEFYKNNKTSEEPHSQDLTNVADVSEKKNKKEVKLKNVTTDHMVSFRHRESQIKEVKKENKDFGVDPLLKRCFCTLKFQKVGKLHKSPIVKSEHKVKDSSVTAKMKVKRNNLMRNAGSETKTNDLKPYECEPYVCIPGECDPFECDKRIKRRHLKELGTETKRTSMKSISTLSRDDNKLKTKKNQAKGDKQRKISINKDPRKVNRFSHYLQTAQMSRLANRQAVRIGSNFSFNIEFYKEGSQNYNQIINGNNKALKGRSDVNMSETKSIKSHKRKIKSQASRCKECCTHNRNQQVEDLQKVSRGSGMAPALKRCFCTLALQKKDIQNISKLMSDEPKPATVSTRNETTLTKAEPFFRNLGSYECEPGICVPGECNPYKCEDLIKKRNIKRNSKKSGTRRRSRVSVASAAVKSTLTTKSKRVQHDGIGKRIRKDSMIVEQSRFPVIRDRISNAKQAVKIGSNFSFNIEFYKEKIPKGTFEVAEYSDGKRNQYSNKERMTNCKSASDKLKMTNTNICKLKNCKMQAQGFETRNRASAVDHALKRCFCTLKLHKPNSKTKRQNVITVGRVDTMKTTSPFTQTQARDRNFFSKSSMKNKKSSPCSFICFTSTNNTKTVATKINEKYLAPDSMHDENQEIKKSSRNKRKNDSTDMKTILPYMPRKFNKNVSKTLLPQARKEKNVSFDKKCLCCQNNFNQEDGSAIDQEPRSISNKNGKIKSGKGRGKTIEIKETTEKPNLTQSKPKGFLCRCIQLFSKQNNTRSVSNECPFEPPNCQSQSQKKSKKDILRTSASERRRPKTAPNTVPKKSKSLKMTTQSENNKSQDKKRHVEKTKKYSKFQSGDAGQNEVVPLVNQARNPKDDSLGKKCKYLNCQARRSQMQNKIVKFTGIPKAKGNFECTYCGKQGNVAKQFQQKSIEDNKTNIFGSLVKCCCTNDTCNKNKTGTLKSLKDTQTNSNNKSLKIRKRDKDLGGQKKLKANKINASAKKSKDCCPCQKNIKSKIKKSSKANKPTARSPDNICLCKSVKKCPCGSRICGKEPKNVVLSTMEPRKPCVCGSVTCARIAKKNQSDMYICECGRKAKKEKNIRQLKQHKEYLKRQKKYQKEDRARRLKRLKENAKMLRDVIKYKNSSDVVLAAESAFDIAKLGCTTLVDVGRSTFRTVTDPEHTYECLKTSVRDPKRAYIGMKSAISDSGVGGTYKRVKLRVGAMSCMKKAKSKLEGCALTNYLIHMVEANPKKRLKRKPKKRKREQLDFGCSLFMSSLRKKPFLYVFNTCPWFYPHCLSMLNIWKQFSDLMLFLLAVVFWSPCIVCMEGCRAMMCCFLCTG